MLTASQPWRDDDRTDGDLVAGQEMGDDLSLALWLDGVELEVGCCSVERISPATGHGDEEGRLVGVVLMLREQIRPMMGTHAIVWWR